MRFEPFQFLPVERGGRTRKQTSCRVTIGINSDAKRATLAQVALATFFFTSALLSQPGYPNLSSVATEWVEAESGGGDFCPDSARWSRNGGGKGGFLSVGKTDRPRGRVAASRYGAPAVHFSSRAMDPIVGISIDGIPPVLRRSRNKSSGSRSSNGGVNSAKGARATIQPGDDSPQRDEERSGEHPQDPIETAQVMEYDQYSSSEVIDASRAEPTTIPTVLPRWKCQRKRQTTSDGKTAKRRKRESNGASVPSVSGNREVMNSGGMEVVYGQGSELGGRGGGGGNGDIPSDEAVSDSAETRNVIGNERSGVPGDDRVTIAVGEEETLSEPTGVLGQRRRSPRGEGAEGGDVGAAAPSTTAGSSTADISVDGPKGGGNGLEAPDEQQVLDLGDANGDDGPGEDASSAGASGSQSAKPHDETADRRGGLLARVYDTVASYIFPSKRKRVEEPIQCK